MYESRIALIPDLYPEIAPFNHDYLSVSGGHQIYFEECGNPNGIPVLFLHGGPGAGCTPKSRRYFDPERCRVILFDQRGSGRSKPFGSTLENRTIDLVIDIREILKHLGINKVLLFGGSWGSTLALVYSIICPETVSGMILRGIFLGEKSEIDYLYKGQTKLFAPTAWERFINQVPENRRDNPLSYYREKITGSCPSDRKHFAYEWARYEESLLTIEPLTDEQIHKEIISFPFESLAIMEVHYFINDCFFREGYIMKHAKKIPSVPISIVQGRYDLVCPPLSAHRLHEALPTSVLHLIKAGHSSSDPEMARTLVSETNRIMDQISTVVLA